jgi:hypothetical protein
LLIGLPLLCLFAFFVVWLLSGALVSGGVRWKAALVVAVIVGVLGVRGTLRLPRETAAASAGDAPGAALTTRNVFSRATDWHVLAHRYAPQQGLGLDEVLIGHAGVFHVSAVRWDGRARLRATPDGRLLFGREDITGHLRPSEQQASAVATALSAATGAPCLVWPVLAIAGDAAPRRPLDVGGVILVRAGGLRHWLAAQPRVLGAEEAAALARVAAEALPHNPLA